MLRPGEFEHVRAEQPKLYAGLNKVIAAVNLLAQRMGVDAAPSVNAPAGQFVQPPKAPASLNVQGLHGHFSAIVGGSPEANAPVLYFLEASAVTSFGGSPPPVVYPLGTGQNFAFAQAGVTRYWRVRAKYLESGYSDYTYFGTLAAPTSVASGT